MAEQNAHDDERDTADLAADDTADLAIDDATDLAAADTARPAGACWAADACWPRRQSFL